MQWPEQNIQIAILLGGNVGINRGSIEGKKKHQIAVIKAEMNLTKSPSI